MKHVKFIHINDYFLPIDKRQEKSVFFYRFNAWDKDIDEFLIRYYMEAASNGVIIEGGIPNPAGTNLQYYQEIFGDEFMMDQNAFEVQLHKWLPRLNLAQQRTLAGSVFKTLDELRRSGKNDNILRNIYIKFMCWLYFRFENVVSKIGHQSVPKILYSGNPKLHEILMLSLLSESGCDIVILGLSGDSEYLKSDPSSALSDVYSEGGPFPQDYSIKKIRSKIEGQMKTAAITGGIPSRTPATNAWCSGHILKDLETPDAERGQDTEHYYNCFAAMIGAEDRTTYMNELYQMSCCYKASKKVVIQNKKIAPPSNDEISKIVRSSRQDPAAVILDFAKNINFRNNPVIQNICRYHFVEYLTEWASVNVATIQSVTNRSVYLLCWLKRYQDELFPENTSDNKLNGFFIFDYVQDKFQDMFIEYLSRLPVDVILFVTDPANKDSVSHFKTLYTETFQEKVCAESFPVQESNLVMETVAFQAERDLNEILYQDTGMYRDQQFSKSNSIILKTMYEEISILWNQEARFRPNFSSTETVVNEPVIFTKVSGVKNGDAKGYWDNIRKLVTQDTLVIKDTPYIRPEQKNPLKRYSVEYLQYGKLARQKIKEMPEYHYDILRPEVQDRIFDKIQDILDQKLIKGIGINGTEYLVIATCLNLNDDIVRLIQKMDLTKVPPKLIYVNTGTEIISKEDTIMFSFLNLMGFDIVFFVPTGYQCIEKHMEKVLFNEHQVGEYMYFQSVPDLSPSLIQNHKNIFKKLFGI